MRTLPNVVITGVPGVGKTVHCTQLVETDCASPPLKHLSINQVVKEKQCHEGFDEDLGSWIVDEEKLLDEIEDQVKDGGWLIDWHACDVFPESWVDLVVVLKCSKTDVLWDRLNARGYSEKKLQENLDAEIFGVLIEEAKAAFDENIVVVLDSEKWEDVEQNCERIKTWIETWMQQRKEENKDGEETT
ncbi:MAG: hypothetical protein Q9160_002370 [Pyrenula sp. 1 TL-2023]